MPVFKGTNWVAFQIKFATYCNRYELDDEEKLERLKLALEDTACRVLYSRDPEAWTYKELIKALEIVMATANRIQWWNASCGALNDDHGRHYRN